MPRRTPSIRQDKLIELLEALYRWDVPEQAWVEGMCEPLRALVPRAVWAVVQTYDVSDFTFKPLSRTVHGELSEALVAQFDEATARFTPAMIARSFLATPVASVATHPELFDRGNVELVTDAQHGPGFTDMLVVNGVDPSGCSACFTLGLVEGAPIRGKAVQLLRRLANHLASAARVRRRIAAATAAPQSLPLGGEAIFSAEGRLLHAEAAAQSRESREHLGEALSLREAARAGTANEEDAAWWPRVDARWTFVDSYEANGTRYIVARENLQDAPALEILSERERQVVASLASGQSTKELAYALGIHPSTARVLLKRAVDKLGVTGRAELLDHPALRSMRGGVEASELKRIRTS